MRKSTDTLKSSLVTIGAAMAYYAIDFGTSNSLINYISDENEVTPVPMAKDGGPILRSLIFTINEREWYFGDQAIEKYIENDGEGRFLRSIKKFLPEPNYKGTLIHEKLHTIDQIIARFLSEMKQIADQTVEKKVNKVVMGRPAKYSLDDEEDQLAEDRMRKACELAGFKEIVFCPEPLAAGLTFGNKSTEEKVILIADLGGGTSDFTLMKLHAGAYSQEDILGLSGIFKAGDALDGEMMRKFISKYFGADYKFTLPMSSKTLTFPKALLKKICSPAHITHLREKETWNYLKEIHQFAKDETSKKQLDQLFALVEWQLGYPIFQQIEKFKIEICNTSSSEHPFKFKHSEIDIEENINTENYFEKMNKVVSEIIATMMDVFEQSGLSPDNVDQVVLTGGTAQFTGVRKRLDEIFGKDKLVEYNIYQSVVEGLSEFAVLEQSKK